MLFNQETFYWNILASIPLERDTSRKMHKILREKLNDMGIVFVDTDVLQITISSKELFHTEESITNLLQITVGELQGKSIGVQDLCPVCRQSDCDVFARVKNVSRPTHKVVYKK